MRVNFLILGEFLIERQVVGFLTLPINHIF